MAKKAKKKNGKKAPQAPRKRPLSNRPVDEPEPPEGEDMPTIGEDGEPTNPEDDEASEPLVTKDTPKKRGRQARLPGTEDAAIEELESAAEEYAESRDERMRIGEEEVELKKTLLDLMQKHKKQKYNHAGVFIEVINSSDKVRVRIKKDE